ncbi:MAG: Permease of the drug/metabolite transporter (DMT) superfamily, partial [uncultured Ramlibacter sp.]
DPQSGHAQTHPAAARHAGAPHPRLGHQLAGDEGGRDRLSAAHVPRVVDLAGRPGAGGGAAGDEGALHHPASQLARAGLAGGHQHVRLARLHHPGRAHALEWTRRDPGLQHADLLGGDRRGAVLGRPQRSQLDGGERRRGRRGAAALARVHQPGRPPGRRCAGAGGGGHLGARHAAAAAHDHRPADADDLVLDDGHDRRGDGGAVPAVRARRVGPAEPGGRLGDRLQRGADLRLRPRRVVLPGARPAAGGFEPERDVHPGAGRLFGRAVAGRSRALAGLGRRTADGVGDRLGAVAVARGGL